MARVSSGQMLHKARPMGRCQLSAPRASAMRVPQIAHGPAKTATPMTAIRPEVAHSGRTSVGAAGPAGSRAGVTAAVILVSPAGVLVIVRSLDSEGRLPGTGG